jgi:hypothetical protein
VHVAAGAHLCDGIASGGRDGRRHQGDSCAHPKFGTVLVGGSRGTKRQDTSSRSDLEPRRDGRLSLRLKLPLIASNCLSCARGSGAMRPPAIASAVAVTQARTGNLRFQTTTIHKQERHGKARSSSPGAPRAPWRAHSSSPGAPWRARSSSQGAPCKPPTRRPRKTCEVWGFGAGVGF